MCFIDTVIFTIDKIMKFRGKMVEISSIQHFTRILNTISKLTKIGVLKIVPTHLYLTFNERITSGGSSLWCEIPQDHYFCEFNMEGLSEEHNEIYLEFQIDNLVTAFRSAQAAKSVKLKLTKKHVPCLTLEVELPSLHSHSRIVVHDVPVLVIPRRLWEQFQEPTMIQFDVSIYMPSLKIVRSVVERMKNIGNHMTMFASSDGEINLCCETDTVTITTHFKDLNLTSVSAHLSEKRKAECRIDIRKFHQFVLGQQINPAKVICNITNNQMVQFFLLHDDVSIQYFLPCVIT
ncbi:checkpoint protein HUS1 isoform X1 [Parasteatoda tepidariorum]|uniref:checkpoint protein HUS1 isoform X1 n=1 Tax=Parasteatoda tepidariorum TaxID=114398 RepID=UPI001C727A5E|nr:checkpoint protein HUS1 [Parasteatoda tepidariorum]